MRVREPWYGCVSSSRSRSRPRIWSGEALYLILTVHPSTLLLPGDPFAGVIRELWQDIPGYKIMDLTSNPNFPNNPSSIEVLDKFDAPHNVDDNYGSRIRGFFKAPESGLYRYVLAFLVIVKKVAKLENHE